MANILKKAVSGLLDSMMGAGTVVAVRAWQPATMYEVDVHLPVDMTKWNTIRRVKCKVGELAFRDYTPARWDVSSSTFTMYVEAGHNGAGARWVKQLKAGDEILLGAVHAAQLPTQEGRILCLGDGTALGHFLALKQLTNFPLEAMIFLHDDYQLPASLMADNPEFTFVRDIDAFKERYMSGGYASFNIAGNIPMVSVLRKQVKAVSTGRIYAYGFWS